MTAIKNILVVNVNWLGDVVFSSAVFAALREAYPEARLTCLAVPRVKGILEHIPCVDEILVYDEKGKHRSPWGKLHILIDLRRRRFDIAFLLHRSLTRALLLLLAGIPVRVGFATKGRGGLLTHPIPPLTAARHRMDEYLTVIESFGVKVRERRTRLQISETVQQSVEQYLESTGISGKDSFIVAHPGGNWLLKRWPLASWIALIQHLGQKGFKVVISGSREEIGLAQSIRDAISKEFKKQVVVLSGELDIPRLLALMRRARVVVSGDSGPLHLASSVGTAVVGLFGPTRPEITGPRGAGRAAIRSHDVGCNKQACYHLNCPDNLCMQAVTVEEVLEAVDAVQRQ